MSTPTPSPPSLECTNRVIVCHGVLFATLILRLMSEIEVKRISDSRRQNSLSSKDGCLRLTKFLCPQL